MRHLELSDAELQVVRNALMREMGHAAPRYGPADVWDDQSRAYWSKVHEIVSRVIDRIDGRAVSTPDKSPAVLSSTAGDAGLCDPCGLPKELADARVRLCNECRASMEELTRACDQCGSPLRTDETVPLCPPCRTKLRQVLAEEVL